MKKYIGGKKVDQTLNKWDCQRLLEGHPCTICCVDCEYQTDCLENPGEDCRIEPDEGLRMCTQVRFYLENNP